MFDLHSHSTASDGALHPAELIQYAKEQGLTGLALTDHDTLAGIAEAKAEAERLGIQFVTGVEIEIEFSPGTFHLLGLGVDDTNQELQDCLFLLRNNRDERNNLMIKEMQQAGIDISREIMIERAHGPLFGRLHFAQILIEQNVAKDHQHAFQAFLGPGGTFYHPKAGLPFETAIKAIHNAGGIGIMAHPLSLHLSWPKLESAIYEFQTEGLDGIEAFHSNAKYKDCRRLEEIAFNYDLKLSAGSDFHTPHRNDRKIGRTCDNKKISNDYAKALGFYTEED